MGVNGPRYFYPPRQRESTISGIHTNGHGKGRWERTTTNTSLDRTDMVHHVEHEARISYTAPSTGPSTPSGTLLEKFGQDYPFWTQQSPSPEHLEDKSVCVSGEPWRSKRVDTKGEGRKLTRQFQRNVNTCTLRLKTPVPPKSQFSYIY